MWKNTTNILVLFITLLSCVMLLVESSSSQYKISMKRLNNNEPVISSFSNEDRSKWLYNYNVAYIPLETGYSGVAVRVQNLTQNPSDIYSVGPSYIVFSLGICNDVFCKFDAGMLSQIVMISPDMDPTGRQKLGCEDPRIVKHENTLYMFYTAVHKEKDGRPSDLGDVRAQLALATCDLSKVKSVLDFGRCWELRGPLFNDIFWTKSGALLVRNNTSPHYLFFGDDDISIAETTDLLNYKNTGKHIVARRSDHFDSALVESGPEPLQLSDGNYLFLYNSARQVSTPNPKPDWHLEYNLGYVVLDKNDPTKVIERASEPIFSPELDWERCDNTSGIWAKRGLTPLVVFIEGWYRIRPDEFIVIYQGCDSVTGTALLTVNKAQ